MDISHKEFMLTRIDGTEIPAIAFMSTNCPGSNWWIEPFNINGYNVEDGEQAMMASKARLFNDDITFDKIIDMRYPYPKSYDKSRKFNSVIKKLGRQVNNFDQLRWNDMARTLVTDILVEKFTQCPIANMWLKSTGNRYIIEGSPYDNIWGVGIHYTDIRINDEKNHRGKNWLGQCLMEARKRIFDIN